MTPSTHGGKRRRHAPRKLDHDQAREVVRLMESGVRRQAIADIYSVHRRTLYASIARLK